MNNDTRSVLHEPTYKAARLVSRAIQQHFTEQLAAATKRGELNLAPSLPKLL